MKTLKNMTGDSLEQMIDYKVVDQNGDSIGTLHSLWSDPTTGAVEFLGVKTGWLFGANHVVPAEKAELDESQSVVRLPYTSLFVKEAPSISADAEISEAEEENIYRYYGLERGTADVSAAGAGQTTLPSSTDIGKIPEAAGASSLASASGQDAGGTQFGAPTSGLASTDSGASRWRRTMRTETTASQSQPASSVGSLAGTPSATGLSTATPAGTGTGNLFGSPETTTPLASDLPGSSLTAAGGTTTASGATLGSDLSDTERTTGTSVNPDPITGEPGSHPVGTGVGALAAGATGMAIGAAVGGPVGAPIGAAIGGVIGAVGGGYAGKAVAESIDPTAENAYWENSYRNASYYENDYDYTDYAPAYRTGYEGYGRYAASGRDYTGVESDLERDYNQNRGSSRLTWDKAKHATRDAWERLKGKVSGPTT